MGTVLQITVVAPTDGTARALADEAVAEARRWDDLLTTWRPEGELAHLNAQAGTGSVNISPELAAALERMVELSRATDGAFDPAVGPLVDLWRGPATPAPTRLARAADQRIAKVLTLHGTTATLAAGAALDAGGIGKGMALDAIAAKLRAGGAEAAFLDFGGSSHLALGAPPGAPQGWRVAVAGTGKDSLHGTIALRDAALSTSRAADGPSPAGPIIDPRSGLPVRGPRLATVYARDATTAEAWSKALIVRGRATIPDATAAGVEVFFEDADGVERSPGFRMQPLDEPQ
jgi:thiamine biosynthesis lipoprotein